nr:insulinase family protein [candidate division Zixibacteria bacterium]
MNGTVKYLLTICGLLIIAGLPVVSPAGQEVGKTILPNGLTLITCEDRATPLVSVALIYHVGIKDEMPGRTGISQLCRQIIAYGTPRNDHDNFTRIIQSGGGFSGSEVDFDLTWFVTKIPSNLLDTVLYLESDRMQNVVITIENLLLAKDALRRDRLVNIESSIYGHINEEFMNLAYKSHTYRNPFFGWPGDVNSITIEDVKNYYRSFFQPANATLVVFGDFDLAALTTRVRELFGPIVSYGVPERRRIIEPDQIGERFSRIQGFVGIPAILLGFHAPEATHEDFPKLGLINYILAGGEFSRLKRKMIVEEKSAMYIGGGVFRTEDPGMFYVYAILNYDTPMDEAEKQICGEIERLKTELVSDAELERAKNRIEVDYYRAIRDIDRTAGIIGFHEIIARDHDYSVKYVKQVRAVNKENILETAIRYLGRENRTGVMLYSAESPVGAREQHTEQ